MTPISNFFRSYFRFFAETKWNGIDTYPITTPRVLVALLSAPIMFPMYVVWCVLDWVLVIIRDWVNEKT